MGATLEFLVAGTGAGGDGAGVRDDFRRGHTGTAVEVAGRELVNDAG